MAQQAVVQAQGEKSVSPFARFVWQLMQSHRPLSVTACADEILPLAPPHQAS